MRFALIVFCPVILMSGCTPKENPWKSSSISTKYAAYNSKRLTIEPKNKFRGIELEIIKNHKGLKGYLNIRSLTLPFSNCDSSKCAITVSTGAETRHYALDILKGRQRMLLSADALEFIIDSLSHQTNVDIATGRFHSTIPSEGFEKAFSKM